MARTPTTQRALGALAVLVLGLAIGGCGSAEPLIDDEARAKGGAGEVEAVQPAAAQRPAAEEGSPKRPRSLALDTPEDAYPLVWVRRGARVEMRTEPGGGERVELVGKRTRFGSPTVFGVAKRVGPWAGVSTASLPNGRLGWVRLDPRRLRAGWTKLAIQVDLSQRRAALRSAGRVVRSFAVTIGAPGYETPTGRYAVTDTFRGDLNPAAYGCCAVALSATQPNVPSGWLGGNRIAIHGTLGPLGAAESHGCVRAADASVDELVDRVPLGTPVFIRE